jgi:hypothetical protein
MSASSDAYQSGPGEKPSSSFSTTVVSSDALPTMLSL